MSMFTENDEPSDFTTEEEAQKFKAEFMEYMRKKKEDKENVRCKETK